MGPEQFPDLERHQVRRQQGIPTVSVLTGPVGLGIERWQHYTARLKRASVLLRRLDFEELVRAWLGGYRRRRSLRRAALRYLARMQGKKEHDLQDLLRNKTQADLDLFLKGVFHGEPSSPTERICCHSLTSLPQDGSEANLVEQPLSFFAESRRPWLSLLEAIHDLEPSWAPAPIVALHNNDQDGITALETAADILSHLAERIPTCPVAWAVPEAAWAKYLSEARESHQKAICRESVSRIRSLDGAEIRRTVEAAKIAKPQRLRGAMARLARDGASSELIASYVRAAKLNIHKTPENKQQVEKARSQAEAFLRDRLESLSETAGIFKLNEKLAIRFRTRKTMEVDLVSRRHRLAIEIDGYYHFRDPENYRRDREKDYVLQQNGFFVLRFLADEVVEHLEEILRRICDTLARRQAENEK